MNYSENVSTLNEKNELPISNINLLQNGLYENNLLPSNELLKPKNDKEQNFSLKMIKDKSGNSRNKNRKSNDLFSLDKSILIYEDTMNSEKKKKNKKEKKKQKRYIVDNIDNIISKLSEPKLKLIFQEYLLYGIICVVSIYYWIFLFLTTTKFEQNYCYTNLEQFDSCSFEQVCNNQFEQINIILYNHSYNLHNHSFKNRHDLLIEENRIINEYYRPFFLRYADILKKKKLFSKIQMSSIHNKVNIAILLSKNEKWHLFIRYFIFCDFETYYIIIIIIMAVGGILGSLIFGILSDILGRRLIILVTLGISTLTTSGIFGMSFFFDYYYHFLLKEFNNNYKLIDIDASYNNILSNLYAQNIIKQQFKNYFIFFFFFICLLSSGLFPLLQSCISLIVENSKGDLKVLIAFRKYHFALEGLPPLFTSILLPNINNFTLTFFILSIFNLFAFIYSLLYLEESIRYYYEFCEWKKLTEVVLNIYKNDISDFRTLNEFELKIFRKEEKQKNFNNQVRKMNSYTKIDSNENIIYVYKTTYFNDITKKNNALSRNLKRNSDFIINLKDVKSNPFLIITSLFSNRSLKKSKVLIFIVLLLLQIVLDLYKKELLEPPYYTIEDLYIDPYCNYIINSNFFIYLIINFLSNNFFYALYRINCFKYLTIFSLIFIAFNCLIYHIETTEQGDSPIDLNLYNFLMLTYHYRDERANKLLVIIYLIYFAINGVIFFVYLLLLKISKTIYRCTFLSIYSISFIISIVISESIYFNMEDYFLFLGSLILLCLLTFTFLDEFKELLYIMNDLKIDIFRSSQNKKEKDKIN